MRVIYIFVFCGFMKFGCGVFLNNSSGNKKIETNAAKWTETYIWGPLLEEWTISNHRQSKVMQLPSDNSSITVSYERDDKQSKISSGGKILTNTNGNRKVLAPGNQVSETDLYLLGAIEKLVNRDDFMEKRLRRVEEMLYYVMAGNRIDQEPCPDNFTRAGMNCYLIASNAGRELDWKAANKQCKKFGAHLAEMETLEENQDIITHIQSSPYLSGKDFWIGGLNPGLLWIWSNSARPVKAPGVGNKKDVTIMGEGRCLRLAYNPALRSYSYWGTDCSVRYQYICELPENNSSNQLRRLGRNRKIL